MDNLDFLRVSLITLAADHGIVTLAIRNCSHFFYIILWRSQSLELVNVLDIFILLWPQDVCLLSHDFQIMHLILVVILSVQSIFFVYLWLLLLNIC